MDHLPLPRNPVAPHPEIDYLCNAEFQLPIGPFLEYPSQRGFDVDKILYGDLGDLDGWQMEGFVQEWLFFGLLSKVLEIPGFSVQTGEFLKKGQFDQDVLSTAPLPKYLSDWRNREETLANDLRQEHARRVEELLQEAKLVVTRLFRTASDYNPLGPASFVIITISETLQNAANIIYGTAIVKRDNFWPRSKWPARRMLASGWCPNRVQMLHSLLTSSAMYYASALDMKDSREGRHIGCSEYKCDLDGQLGPPSETLTSVLANGGIPLIRLIERSPNHFEVETVERTLAHCHKYVALSHVWSDGRGNLKTNTLPICQLKHLQKLASDTLHEDDGPTLFWLDTLCVPVSGEYRKVAISRMRQTYECATTVLVLDSELEAAELEATSPEELLMRISCCGWMRRLWTLQEGALAQQLVFKFRGGPAVIQDIVSDSMRCLDHFQKFKNCGAHRVLELVEALQWRNTSWKKDEALCISILLDLDAGKIEATTPEDRMYELLVMMEVFPSHLMFAPGLRLPKKGFRWSSSSLMPAQGFGLPDPHTSSMSLGMQSHLGLIATLPGLFLPCSKVSLNRTSWFRINNDDRYYRMTNYGEIEDDGPSWLEIGLHNIESPAIVLGGGFGEGRDDDNGALVSIISDDERLFVAEFVCRVFISIENGEISQGVMDRMIQAESRGAIDGEPTTAVLTGSARHIPTRKWCIQ